MGFEQEIGGKVFTAFTAPEYNKEWLVYVIKGRKLHNVRCNLKTRARAYARDVDDPQCLKKENG